MEETALSEIQIVLVEPAGALNVGSAARIMANMGLHQLVLVNPQCDHLGDEARKMAVHAREILENARCVASLEEALAGCQRVMAATGRDRALTTPLEAPRQALSWLLDVPSALVFGREDRGLSNEELNLAQRLIRIPATTAYTSLNLAQAVAVCAYELYTLAQTPAAATPNSSPSPDEAEAPLEALEAYYQDLEAMLLEIGYLYPHTARSRMEKFRRLHNRAHPSVGEVAMLRGILRQVGWALQHKTPSA